MLPPKIGLAFFLLFSISIAFRSVTLNRPLSVRHENNTAQSLVTMKGWESKGLRNSAFLPIVSFQNPGDKNISNFGGVKDVDGNYYYVSYPPFGFLLPYLALNLFHLELNILNLQLWNIFLHGAGALLILLLLFNFSPFQGMVKNYSALLGAVLYLFAPGPLWFHANVYFLENSLLPLWLGTLYVLFGILYQKYKSPWAMLALFICNFFASYTEWTMVFFNAVAIVWILFSKQSFRRWPLIAVLVGSSGLAIATFLLQAINLNGWEAFTSFIIRKFKQRSGFSPVSASEVRSAKGYLTIVGYYFLNFTPVLVFTASSFFLAKKQEIQKASFSKPWILFTVVPIAIFHFVFFNFSRGHEYSSLKGVIPLSLLGSLWFGCFLQGLSKKRRVLVSYSYVGLVILFGGLIFLMTNVKPSIAPLAFLRSLGTPTTKPLKLGQEIASHSKQDEMIFIRGDSANPPVVLFYAQRNIQFLKPGDKVESYLIDSSVRKAVIFDLDYEWNVKKVQRVALNP